MQIVKKMLNISLLVPVIFFIVSVITLSDYGMNSDSPVHFSRGQADLRYLLTGKTDYNDLKPICQGKDKFPSRVDYKTGEVCDRHRENRRSEYQHPDLNFDHFKKDIYGHPATSDVLLAVFNQIFFIKLGWLEDIPAYHLYNVFATFLMALCISFWMKKTFGTFASAIAIFSLYTFPLLFGEQHFNVKDPPMAAFFIISLFFFWLAFTENKARYLLLSALSAGISFGTKFNYLFAPFILFPWTTIFLGMKVYTGILRKTGFRLKKTVGLLFRKIPKKFVLLLLLYPIIVFSVFYFTWPDLWFDPSRNVPLVFKFYRDIGTTDCPYSLLSKDWFSCSNPLAISYFMTTIPIVTLIYFFVGLFLGIVKWKKHNYVTLLWITFLLFTIVRVTMPGSSIYSGVRQIMEFIAPTAMLAGIGALSIRDFIVRILAKNKFIAMYGKQRITLGASILLIACFLPIIITLIRIHPNENVYFNSVVGGLRGAQQKNMYAFGYTYGNIYYQAVKWLNQHAEKNAKMALVWGLAQNLSRIQLREDFSFTPANLSAYNQKGEYQIASLEQNSPVFQTFWYNYVNKYLVPIYTVEVEGVPLLKIWKNDPQHTKPGVNIKQEKKENILVENKDSEILIKLGNIKKLKRLEINFNDRKRCMDSFGTTQVFISENGTDFTKQQEDINAFNWNEIDTYKADYSYFFTEEQASVIKLIPPSAFSCNKSDVEFSLYSFERVDGI